MKRFSTWLILLLLASLSLQAAQRVHRFPRPQTSGGMPLYEALARRASVREFHTTPIPDRVLGDLLWAAFGINRKEDGKHTAPSTRNWQAVEIYICTSQGVFRYLPEAHGMLRLSEQDIRSSTGTQHFAAEAPVNLIYVADTRKMKTLGGLSDEEKVFHGAADTGFIAQNVYLFCASEGLNTVVRSSVDREELSELIGLEVGQTITLCQTVGYPPVQEEEGNDR